MLDELAKAVRDGQVSPLELVDEALRRIDALDPALNAVIALRADQARAEARASDRSGPLAGVPVLVKELNRVAGMRHTMGGSPFHAEEPVAERDDPVVARLRAAGAIVVGLTNSPMFGHTAVTTNPLFGSTRNPWNPARSPGGSSGGSAAALAAGFAPLATTTDGGGSVRIPASLCGLVGYKPTIGAVGRPPAPRWMTFSTNGATNATVADVVTEATVCFGAVAGDLQSLPLGAIDLEVAPPARVVACRTLRADTDPAVAAAFERTCAVLADEIGLPVEEAANPFGDDLLMTWYVIAAAELAQSLGGAVDQLDHFEPSLQLMVRTGLGVTASDYLACQRRRYELCAAVDDLVGPDGVFLTPTVNSLSWPAEGPMADHAGSVSGDPSIAVNTPEFNLTGHPAVSVPMGIGPDGVPLGLQVVGPRWRDGLALGVAAELERVRPWPHRAPGYEPFPVP